MDKPLPPLPEKFKTIAKPINPEIYSLTRLFVSNVDIGSRLKNPGNATLFNDTRPTIGAAGLQKCDPSLIKTDGLVTFAMSCSIYKGKHSTQLTLDDENVVQFQCSTFFGVPQKNAAVEALRFYDDNFHVLWDNALVYVYDYDDLDPLMRYCKAAQNISIEFLKSAVHYMDTQNVYALWKSFLADAKKVKVSGVIPFNAVLYIVAGTVATEITFFSYRFFGDRGSLYHVAPVLPYLNVLRFDTRSTADPHLLNNLRYLYECYKKAGCLKTLTIMANDFIANDYVLDMFDKFLYPITAENAHVTFIVDCPFDDVLLQVVQRLQMQRTNDSLYADADDYDHQNRYYTFYGKLQKRNVIFCFLCPSQ